MSKSLPWWAKYFLSFYLSALRSVSVANAQTGEVAMFNRGADGKQTGN